MSKYLKAFIDESGQDMPMQKSDAEAGTIVDAAIYLLEAPAFLSRAVQRALWERSLWTIPEIEKQLAKAILKYGLTQHDLQFVRDAMLQRTLYIPEEEYRP